MNSRNSAIDLTKFIMSLCIVAIHAALFSDVNDLLNFSFVHIICRLGVPFFAVCSGYYTAERALKEKTSQHLVQEKRMFLRQWYRLIRLYLTWSLCYLLFSIPIWVETGWFSLHAFIDYAVATVLNCSYYHFWYLLGLVYAFPLFFFCIHYMSMKTNITIATILYSIHALLYGYTPWLPKWLLQAYIFFDTNTALNSAIFCILPFLLLGAYIQNKKNYSIKKSALFLGTSLVCLFIEAFFLKSAGITKFSYILSTFPTAFSFFLFVITSWRGEEKDICTILGKISVFIYCVHPMFLEVLRKYVYSSVLLFILASFFSALTGALLIKINMERIPNEPI